MRIASAIIFVVISLHLLGQTGIVCDTVYGGAEFKPRYKGGDKAMNDYVNKVLIPLLDNCPQRRGENDLDRVIVALTVDKNGNVIKAEFPKLQISDKCKESFKKELLSMKGWTPGQNQGHNVCSKYVLKFTIEEINKGLGTY